MKIKNCGLKSPDSVACAARCGASFVGFVHHPTSPRHVTASEIASLAPHVSSDVKKVIVLVNPDDALLASLPAPDFWQIHGVESPARLHAIYRHTNIPVIGAVRVRTAQDVLNARPLEEVCEHILFDAYHAEQAGGAGITFDWSLLAGLQLKKPWFLAGGLTSQNVAEALRLTRAPMVDVSSGIETSPGVKSNDLIASFNAAVLHAAHG